MYKRVTILALFVCGTVLILAANIFPIKTVNTVEVNVTPAQTDTITSISNSTNTATTSNIIHSTSTNNISNSPTTSNSTNISVADKNKPVVAKNNPTAKPQETTKPKTVTQIPTPKSTTASTITSPQPNPMPAIIQRPFKPLSWGVYAGATPEAIEDFESRTSANPDYLAYFIHWGNDKGQLRPWIKDYAYHKDRTLIIFWEASDHDIGGTDQPAYSYRTILNGEWDHYIKDFANQLENYGGPVILVPFSELNGNWTPWAGTKNGNTPQQAVAAFRYIHDHFDGIKNVKIGWAVNSHSVPDTPENQITNYYPGDAYVDIVGVDGFNMNWPWMSFSELFDAPIRTVSQYNKPVFLFSFGSAEGPQKSEWLHDALYTQLPRYPQVEAWIYFNQNKERNWLLWSDEATFKVFKGYVEN